MEVINDDFNPRAPCGARPTYRKPLPACLDFNPRAPCGARPPAPEEPSQNITISTHAPLAGRDAQKFSVSIHTEISTHAPLAGRDPRRPEAPEATSISTHAPLAGRDSNFTEFLNGNADFNPRAPCGARQQKCTNHYAHFCDNRQISDAFAQNAACQGILLLFDAGKSCGFWVRTAQVISAHLCFAL